MTQTSKDALFYIETEAQFDAIKSLLIHVRDNTDLQFDIVVPESVSQDTAFNREIYNSAATALEEGGFRVNKCRDGRELPPQIADRNYKILLSAYISQWQYENIHAKFRIMYPYASYYFNKPYWTIRQFIEQDYLADALLSHATGTKDVTDIFTKTHIVPPLKLANFKKSKSKRPKPVLFFAPTYEEVDFAARFLESVDEIKTKYTVAMRGHHRVSRLDKNKSLSEKLYENADRIYDAADYSIITPLQEADIVLSDNSGVIFDAIYCNVPVALFSQDPNSFHYQEIATAQSELVKAGEVLWTDKPANIVKILDNTLSASMLKRQKEMSQRLFPLDRKHPIEQWMDVLSYYLNEQPSRDYTLAKQYWVASKKDVQLRVQELSEASEALHTSLASAESTVRQEQNPGVKTAAKRLVKAVLYKAHVMKREDR